MKKVSRVLEFFKQNIFFSVFFLILLLLLNGVVATSGTEHLDLMIIVFGTFIISYFLFDRILKEMKFSNLKLFDKIGEIKYLPIVLFIFCVALFLTSIIDYGGVPVLKLRNIHTVVGMTTLRREIQSHFNLLFVYLYSWNLKAITPFALLLFYFTKRRWLFWILLAISCTYAFSMLHKSYILSVIAPVSIIMLYKKRFFHFILLALISFATIYSLVAIKMNIVKQDKSYNPMAVNVLENTGSLSIIEGIERRVFVVPGEMVSDWFTAVPKIKPYLYGDGYGLIAKIKGEKVVNYSVELYPIVYPKNAEKGLKGTVNVATFLRGYANFGIIGLIFSCLLLAVFFIFLKKLFKGISFEIILAVNLFPILLLSSTNVLTDIMTHGWGVLIIELLIFRKVFADSKAVESRKQEPLEPAYQLKK